jgi:hypothetical protein
MIEAAPPGRGAKEGESTIMDGGGGSSGAAEGGEVAWDVRRLDVDGEGAAGLRSITVSRVGSSGLDGCLTPPSREPPSTAGVCGGAVRASVNFELLPLWGTVASADGAAAEM